jgi:hypothetical protein
MRHSIRPPGCQQIAILVERESEDARSVPLAAGDILLLSDVPEPHETFLHAGGQNETIGMEL